MSRSLQLALLLALILAAGALRFSGVGFLLPQRVGPDTVVLEQEVRLLTRPGSEERRQHQLGLYPELLPFLASSFAAADWEQPLHSGTLPEHLAQAAHLRVEIRQWIAALSLIGILATFWIARSFLSPPWALFASALVAFSLLTQWYAQEGRPHGAASALLVLAVAAALELRRAESVRTHMLAGLALGFAAGALQYGFAALPSYLAALLLSPRRPRCWSGLVLGLLMYGACLLVFYQQPGPEHVTSVTQAAESHGALFSIAGHALNLYGMNGKGSLVTFSALWAYEPLLLAGGLTMLVVWIVRSARARWQYSPDLLVVLAFVVPYAALMLIYQGIYARFLLPLVPFLACAMAALFERICAGGRSVRPVQTLAGCVLVFQAADCVQLARLRSRPDTLTQAAEWIERERPAEERTLVLPNITLPLFSSPESLSAEPNRARDPSLPWHVYQHRLLAEGKLPAGGRDVRALDVRGLVDAEGNWLPNPTWAQELPGDTVVIEVRERSGWKGLEPMRAELQRHYQLAASFAPDQSSHWKGLPIEYQDFELPERPWWFLRVWQAECTGPVLEVYTRRP